MKTQYRSLTFCIIVLTIISCRKVDFVPADTGSSNNAILTSAQSRAINITEWIPLSLEDESNSKAFTDDHLGEDVLDEGLVLVFLKKDNSMYSLPFTEKIDNQRVYWYYQLTEGKLIVGSNKELTPGIERSVKYFTISRDKLVELSKSGYDRKGLRKLSYESLLKLLELND